ncbi:hypothetical protein BDE02_06G038100 [Populus trichocarpa]|nr:hypothetical protein BDE02_06G038100 [Populus trichocarpa]
MIRKGPIRGSNGHDDEQYCCGALHLYSTLAYAQGHPKQLLNGWMPNLRSWRQMHPWHNLHVFLEKM